MSTNTWHKVQFYVNYINIIIYRKIFKEAERCLESEQSIMITGMRRVGKITLLSYFFEKIQNKNNLFIDLEDPLNQAVFESDNY